MAEFDLVIRGGRVIDGTGAPGLVTDVAVRDGKIVALGKGLGAGAEEIDATGLLVTPGFVDLHTHYDGQAIWSDRLQPSSLHGVTTAVLGNCGVGFAPCRSSDHDELVSLMEGVEDIPEAVLHKGLTWDWETFPQYLDRLASAPRDIDVGALLPHSPLRAYVMGERGLRREAATADDMARMQELLEEAMVAGALGFGTSRTAIHRNGRGEFIPSFETDAQELHMLGATLARLGRGVIQGVPNVAPEAMQSEIELFIDLARKSGRPAMVTLVQTHDDPLGWREQLRLIAEAQENDGVPVYAQVFPRATAVILGLGVSLNPFTFCPSFTPLADLSLAERVQAMRNPALRATLVSETPVNPGTPFFGATRHFARMFVLDRERPDYEQSASQSIMDRASALGMTPEELAYDLLLEDDGTNLFYLPVANYADADLDAVREMMASEHTLFGLGDGGAHYGLVCDSGFPTFLLAYWTRDREGERMPLEWAIKGLTSDAAKVVGLSDRGIIAPGFKADINLIDYAALRLNRPEVIADLPSGGRRLVEIPAGYRLTMVGGTVTYRDGKPTGALPGKLVRGACDPVAA